MLIVLMILVIVCTIVSQLTLKSFEKQAIDQFFVQISSRYTKNANTSNERRDPHNDNIFK